MPDKSYAVSPVGEGCVVMGQFGVPRSSHLSSRVAYPLGMAVAASGFLGLFYFGILTQGCDPMGLMGDRLHVVARQPQGWVHCRLETFEAFYEGVLAIMPSGAGPGVVPVSPAD